jgi:hypothetical protein
MAGVKLTGGGGEAPVLRRGKEEAKLSKLHIRN